MCVLLCIQGTSTGRQSSPPREIKILNPSTTRTLRIGVARVGTKVKSVIPALTRQGSG